MKLPKGYEPHEIPANYAGPLFLEAQMRYAYEKGQENMRKRAAAEAKEYGGFNHIAAEAIRSLPIGVFDAPSELYESRVKK